MSESTKDLLVTIFKVCFSLFAGGGFVGFALWGFSALVDFVRGIWSEYRWWSLVIMIPVLAAGIGALGVMGYVAAVLIYNIWTAV